MKLKLKNFVHEAKAKITEEDSETRPCVEGSQSQFLLFSASNYLLKIVTTSLEGLLLTPSDLPSPQKVP